MNDEFDCVVIGSGPGGYVAALRAAQKNLKTALIESFETGGTCLNRGCIPSKALIAGTSLLKKIKYADKYGIQVDNYSFDFASMMNRKSNVVSGLRKGLENLIKHNKIQCFNGRAKLDSENEIKILGNDACTLKAKNIILATGSEPKLLPGISLGKNIIDSTGILNLSSLPKSMVIIGGGVIGCEFASLFSALGTQVTIVEALPRILAIENKELSSFISNSFKKEGISILTNAHITSLTEDENQVTVVFENDQTESFSKALIAIGRVPNTQDLGLEKTGVITDERGFILTDDCMQTNVPNIYAIGDITGKWLLAHVASHQGIVAVEQILGHPMKMDYSVVPSVIFTSPEVASVGLSFEKALEQGLSVKKSTFPFRALGKALAIEESEGFATIISDSESKQILGACVAGPHASSLIGEMALAIKNELTLPCVYETIHPHPTLSEIWAEAALLADEQPLHIPKNKS
ncbi:MAG: dihydrolipoyl dehydrogenase [Victivallaceae bacterium]